MPVQRAAELLGYEFKNSRLLEESMRHASAAEHRLASNERMEFLGDAILGYFVCEHLYNKYPGLLEGDLTKIKSAVVSRRVCAEISEKLSLSTMLDLGKGMTTHGAPPTSVLAAVLESVIAAIYLDGGIEPAREFVLRHFNPYIEQAEASAHQQNFKSVLQQFAQRHLPSNPSYIVLDEKGPDHSKAFEVCVTVAGRQYPAAWANSKKEAEQQAALNALLALGISTIDDDGQVQIDDDRLENGQSPEPAGDDI